MSYSIFSYSRDDDDDDDDVHSPMILRRKSTVTVESENVFVTLP